MGSILFFLVCWTMVLGLYAGVHDIEEEEINCAKVRVDLTFVVDSSSSISEENFKLEKTFIADLAGSFDIGPDKSRIGMVNFASAAQIVFGFVTYTNSKDVLKAIMDMKQLTGVTALGAGIKLAGEGVMKESRPGLSKYMIVMTDGRNNKWPKPSSVTPSLKKDGVIFISIGIGNDVDPNELKGISSSNSYLNVSDFSKINLFLDDIKKEICKVKVKSQLHTCETEGDLTFILDTVNSQYVPVEKDLLTKVLKRFEISPTKQRVATIVDGYGVIVPLDKFNNRDDYIKYLAATKFESDNKGQSGLSLSGKILSENRQDVPKSLVLIRAHEDSKPNDDVKVAAELRNRGYNIITIGLGSEVKDKTLDELSSTKKTIHSNALTFDVSYINQISEIICQNLKKVYTECKGKLMDLVFVLDSSASVGPENWLKELQFTTRIISMMDISNTTSRVGAIYFSSEAYLGFKIGKYTTKKENQDALLKLPYNEGVTAIGSALELARLQISTDGRANAVPVIILVTDGHSNAGVKPEPVARNLKKEGVHIISVGITDSISKRQLKLLSSTNEIVNISDFNSLESFPVEALTKESCQATKSSISECFIPKNATRIEL